MELKLIGKDGQSAENISASDALFGREYNEALVHQLVTAYMANARSANRAQKGRSDVNKSTRKPWRQKGTGRARAGMASSPLWRGGGKIFPSSPNDNFSHKVNRKMYRAGMSAILSQLVRDSRLSVVDKFTVDSPKTKLLAQKLKEMGLKKVMLITDKIDENLYLSSRNLPNVMVVEVGHADPVSLLRYDKIIMTQSAVTKIEEMLS
jgi:large subunit ribosomal protein L4